MEIQNAVLICTCDLCCDSVLIKVPGIVVKQLECTHCNMSQVLSVQKLDWKAKEQIMV